LGDGVIVGVEGEVATEESVRRLAGAVTVGLAAVVGTVGRFGALLALDGEVNVDVAAVELGAGFGGVGLTCVDGVDEFDVAESRRC
jgi:FlaG/FlaF family flagellin (archaellin)